MPDVFLSYSREDQAVARGYAVALQAAGFDVWWDVVLKPGETFDAVTEGVLREARAVVVLWSKQSVGSRWVRSEATQADRYGSLVPVMIEACDRPILFELAHTVDLSGWSGDVSDARWPSFVEGLRHFVDQRTALPSGTATTRTASITASMPTLPSAKAAKRRLPTVIAVAATLAIVAIGATVIISWRGKPVDHLPLMRLTMSFQDDVSYTVGEDFVRSASISPDGTRIVFTGSDRATGTARLFLRAVDSNMSTALQDSENGTEPFWSPDSRSVGFSADGKIKIAQIAGGPARELASANSPGGGTWSDQGVILIKLQNPGPIMRIASDGGAPRPATQLETGDLDHDWPQFLDDGAHFLYVSRGRTPATHKVYLASLDSPGRTLLVDGVSAYTFASPDRLVYLKNGALLSQLLDAKRGVLTGAPFSLADNAVPPLSASRTGAFTYRSVPTRPNPLLWIKPDGTPIGDAMPPGYYTDPQISPDGTQLALAIKDSPSANYDVAIVDLATNVLRKLTFNPAVDRAPVWSPDGKSVVYLSVRPDAPGLYRKNANGVGAEELVLASKGVVWPYHWSKTGLSIFDGVSGSNDISMLMGDDLRKRVSLVETRYNDVDGAVSPDGKWFAYTSNSTGRWELYLTTTEPSGTTLPITTEGGCDPIWSPDGTMLYYTRPSTAELMMIPVTQGDPPRFGTPHRIHPGPLEYPSAHSADFDPKGHRLILAPSFAVQGDLAVLINWQSAGAQKTRP